MAQIWKRKNNSISSPICAIYNIETKPLTSIAREYALWSIMDYSSDLDNSPQKNEEEETIAWGSFSCSVKSERR